MKYQLRNMTIDDIDDVVKGEMNIFGNSLGYDLIYSDLTLNPYAHYIVLEINNEVHGYVGLWITDNMEMINFYVDKEYQGMGYGSLMMDFIIELCKNVKVNNLSLEVRKSNEKAIHLYEKYGLEKSHIREKYYDNKEDAILMVRSFEVEE